MLNPTEKEALKVYWKALLKDKETAIKVSNDNLYQMGMSTAFGYSLKLLTVFFPLEVTEFEKELEENQQVKI